MSTHGVKAVIYKGFSLRLLNASKGFALFGGAMFILMVLMSVVSIIGRKLWNTPIHGDFELFKMGTGVAAAAFFPYCTIMGEHLRVEFFTTNFSARKLCWLDSVANLLLATMMGFLTWRSLIQTHEIYNAGEVTTMREIPVWIPIGLLVPSLFMTSICALDRAIQKFSERSLAS